MVFWFSAHVVMRVMFKDGNQDHCPLMENIILISAENEEDALTKAEIIGSSLEGDNEGSFEWCDRPAEWKFIGIRKLLEVRNSLSRNDMVDDASEVSYSIFDIKDVDELNQFMSGGEIYLKMID